MASKAKTYIYRNLNKGGFSSKFQGKVVSRFGNLNTRNTAMAFVDGFRVSEAVRKKIVETGKKQVHAYVMVDMLFQSSERFELDNWPQVKYNPRTDSFFYVTDGTPIDDVVFVVFQDDKVYAFTAVTLNSHEKVRDTMRMILDTFWPTDND